ncbi:MAG: von Willebrand factor type A domain-containing protein, partial [Candidatus Sericytochromatia bacterium]
MKSTHPLQRLSVLLLGLAALTACGPAPNTNPSPTPSPSATATATAEPSPSATATAEPTPTAMATPITVGTPYPSTTPAPSVYPSQPPTPEPSPMPSATATASATSTPTASASATPEPTPTPEVDIHELRENFFKNYGINPFVEATTDPLSTFAVDVDTASYTIARNYINSSQLPPPAAVRTEEFLNYFDYHYPQPVSGKFAIHTDLAPSFFGDTATRLMRVGIQGLEVLDKDRKQANLTFVIDVSGSMNQENRLELVKKSLRLLLEQLNPNDMVGIVIYGNEARVVQEPTSVSNKALITSIINNLRPEGSTNAEAGLL